MFRTPTQRTDILKQIYSGCHDNGYATTLRSLITAGFQDKLVLLRGYSESAVGIEELGLPAMTIPQLFLTEKLVTSQGSLPGLRHGRSRSGSFADSTPQVPRASTPLPPSSLQSSCTYIEDEPLTATPAQVLEFELDPLPFASTETVAAIARPPAPPSYKSALQAVQMARSRPNTPELDAAGSSASSDTSDEALTDHRASPPLTRSRHINPNLVEWTGILLNISILTFFHFYRSYQSTNLRRVHFSISQTASMALNVNTATIIFYRKNTTKPFARTQRRHLVLQRTEVSRLYCKITVL